MPASKCARAPGVCSNTERRATRESRATSLAAPNETTRRRSHGSRTTSRGLDGSFLDSVSSNSFGSGTEARGRTDPPWSRDGFGESAASFAVELGAASAARRRRAREARRSSPRRRASRRRRTRRSARSRVRSSVSRSLRLANDARSRRARVGRAHASRQPRPGRVASQAAERRGRAERHLRRDFRRFPRQARRRVRGDGRRQQATRGGLDEEGVLLLAILSFRNARGGRGTRRLLLDERARRASLAVLAHGRETTTRRPAARPRVRHHRASLRGSPSTPGRPSRARPALAWAWTTRAAAARASSARAKPSRPRTRRPPAPTRHSVDFPKVAPIRQPRSSRSESSCPRASRRQPARAGSRRRGSRRDHPTRHRARSRRPRRRMRTSRTPSRSSAPRDPTRRPRPRRVPRRPSAAAADEDSAATGGATPPPGCSSAFATVPVAG